MSEPIENYVIPNEPSNHNLDRKRLLKRHRTFRRDRKLSRIPIRTMQRLSNKRKLFIDVFTDVAAGFPGSLHDARVLQNSSIYQKAKNGDVLAAGPMYLIGADEIQPYLVGDSAYPLSPWLQKPFPEGTRDPGEIRFNKELSSALVLVESAFGIMKSLWRILDVIEERNIAAVSKIIVACAVLHNFCILAGDEWDKDDFNDDDNGPNNNDDVLRDGELSVTEK